MSTRLGNLLVTGGAGYIGSHICKALALAGWTPVVYDSLVNGHDWAVKWGPLEIGDMRDKTRLAQVVATYRPKAVFHLAGLIEAGVSMGKPYEFFDVNLSGTLNLLEVMQEAAIQTLIFSSTAAVYGKLNQIPVDENHICDPISPYGQSKYLAEKTIATVASAVGMNWTSLRYFNACGADPEGEIGEAHRHETHLIPLALDVLQGKAPVFNIFGNDYETPDGSCIRDFIHVQDLAQAHLKAFSYLRQGGKSLALNLGSGQGSSIFEILDCLSEIAGKEVPTKLQARREGDPPILVSNPTLAQKVLGWSVTRSDRKNILQDAWNWHNKMDENLSVNSIGMLQND